MDKPDFLKRGEIARLIPVIADTRKEQRAVSTLLAVVAAVPRLGHALLEPLGQGVSQRTVINTYTEVELCVSDKSNKDRPDGLIQLVRRKKSWHALVEAKIGNASLGADQIERYLKLARENSIDSVITISNEFAPRPTHHPVSVSKQLLRSVQLFHLSWTHILTEAILLQDSSQVSDLEQAFLLRELIRFLSHDSVGIKGYTSMPACWTKVVSTFQSGGGFGKRDDDLEDLVSGWHQECRDLSLRLSRFLGRKADVHLPRKFVDDSVSRVTEEVERLRQSGELSVRLRIPDTASDIVLVADLRSTTIRVSVELDAPDKKRLSSKVNWLLRQLKDATATDVTVRLKWTSRAADKDIQLSALAADPKCVDNIQPNANLRAFEIIMTSTSGRRFKGVRTFIEEVESICPQFYEQIVQHLKKWQPTPPKPKDCTEQADDSSAEPPRDPVTQQPIGNQHSALLDPPSYLNHTTEAD